MSSSCDATAIDWAALVTSIIVINLAWWILEIPKPYKHKPKVFVDAVAWQCLRMCFPPVAAIYAITSTSEHKLWPKRYYNGPKIEDEREEFKTWDLLKSSAINSITVVSVALSIYRLYNSPDQDASGWNSSLWSFPGLPVTVYGLIIQIASALKLRQRNTLILGLLFAVSVGAGVGVAISQSANPSFTIAIIIYAIMALPIVMIFPVIQIALPILGITMLARIGGVAVGALDSGAYFPFCPLKGPGFAVPYIVFGVAAGLITLYASLRFSSDMLAMLEKWMPSWIFRRPAVENNQTEPNVLELGPHQSPPFRQD